MTAFFPSSCSSCTQHGCAHRLLERQKLDNGNAWPETIAVVLWGTDNIKTYGESLAQVCKLYRRVMGLVLQRAGKHVCSVPVSHADKALECCWYPSHILEDTCHV